MRFLKVSTIILCISAVLPSNASPLSISSGSNPFIPIDVLDQLSQSDLRQKLKFCVGNSKSIFRQLENLAEQPPSKLEGFNSRMDNGAEVVGSKELDLFSLRMSEGYTDAWMSADDSKKERLLGYLARWAEAGALLETYNCMSKGTYDGFECAEWRQKDGQDLSKAKDHGTAQMGMMHLAYGYYLLLSDFRPADPRHAAIQTWLKQFFARNKDATKVYFGMDLGWHWPNVIYGRLTGAGNFSKNNPGKLLNRAVKKLDSLINPDGSFVNRTTRGNRALWYHLTGLNETLITLEMARASGIKISDDLDDRVEKAAEIFIRGFEDHSYMDQWAKVAHNAIYVPGEQIFSSRLASPNGNAAMFILMYRYPESEAANKIAEYLSRTPNAGRMDSYIGFGMGCFYAVAKEVRDGSWTKPRNATRKANSGVSPSTIPFRRASAELVKDAKNFSVFRVFIDRDVTADVHLDSVQVTFDYANATQKKQNRPYQARMRLPAKAFMDPSKLDEVKQCREEYGLKASDSISDYPLFVGDLHPESQSVGEGELNSSDKCFLQTMSDEGRTEAERLLTSIEAILAHEDVRLLNEDGSYSGDPILLGSLEDLDKAERLRKQREEERAAEIERLRLPVYEVSPLQFKVARVVGSYSDEAYRDIKYELQDIAIDGSLTVLQALRFNLMFDLDRSDSSKAKLIRIEVAEDQFPQRIGFDSLENCRPVTFKSNQTNLESIRLVLGEEAYDNKCMLSSLTELNRSVLLGIKASLSDILGATQDDQRSRLVARLLDVSLEKQHLAH